MKHLIQIACAALCLAACTEELAKEISTANNRGKINVSIINDVSSRVQLDDDCKIVWNEGDTVRIYKARNNATKLSELWLFDGRTGDADGTLSFARESETNRYYGSDEYTVAIYPANQTISEGHSSVGQNVYYSIYSFIVPEVQAYMENSYAPITNLMVAISTEAEPTSLQFNNLMGYIRLSITGTSTVSSIELQGNNNEGINGRISLFKDNVPSYPFNYEGVGSFQTNETIWKLVRSGSGLDDSEKKILLDCGEGVVLSPDEPTEFYIGIIPHRFHKGITAKIHLKNEPVMIQRTSQELNIERNHIVPMETFICEPQYTPDDEIWYTSTTNKTINITNMNDFGANIISNTYSDGRGIIKFDGPISKISDKAFFSDEYDETHLTSITIPNNVTEIGKYAFYGCSELSDIHLPENLQNIGIYAFYGCTSLTNVKIPNNIDAIYGNTFGDCKNLETVILPDGLSSIWKYAFAGCNKLSEINLPSSLTYIDSYAFSSTSIPAIDISESVTYLGDGIFKGCEKLKNASLPGDITKIGDEMFSGCHNLSSFNIPSNVTSIGASAFEGCSSLTSINIPSNVTSIGASAFEGCSSLTSINIPSTVTSVDDYAFSGCNISEISIFYNIGSGVFKDCKSLKKVEIINEISCIEEETFCGCTNLYEINIPDTVLSLEDYAFKNCSSLTDIILPAGIIKIGSYAFEGCCNLTTINLPEGLETLEQEAFSECSSLTKINIPSSISLLQGGMFYGCSSLTEIIIPAGIQEICDANGKGAFQGCNSLKTIIIKANLRGIGSNAFKDCSSLENIDLSQSTNMWSINPYAFQGCSNLKSIILPESLRIVHDSAFYDCYSLSNIILPANISTIRSDAFNGCLSLKEIQCKAATPPSLTITAFANTPDDMIIYVPEVSLNAYMAAETWAAIAGKLVGYDF